jgi:MoaA/NifB/PqqE/SkfB family radical SAM enzyme
MKFIKIYREPVIKKVVWTVTTVCNYNCSYCPEDLHDSKYRWPENYQPIIELVNKWRGDSPVTLDILGGEPTLWPKFTDFCNDIVSSSDQFTKLIFSSNGSRSIRYWEDFNAPISSLGLSFHPEEADVEHFLKVVETVDKKYPVTVWLMLSYPHLELIKHVFERLKQFNVTVRVMSVVGKINNAHQTILNDLTEYKDFSLSAKLNQSLPFRGPPYRSYATDGIEIIPIDTQDLINLKQDAFKGWSCYVGKDTLYISPSGDVSGSSCSVGPCYGNVFQSTDIKLPTLPVTCPYDYCGCGTDIEIEKHK